MYNAPKERKMTKVYSNCGCTSISDCKRLKSIVWKSEKNTSLTGSHYSKKIPEKTVRSANSKNYFFFSHSSQALSATALWINGWCESP